MPGLDPITIAAAGAQALTGLAQTVDGFFQSGRAKRLAAANKRPFYRIPGDITDDARIARSEAAEGGLSDQARSLYTQESDRGLTAGIDALTMGGGTIGNIGELYSARNAGLSNMVKLDEGMRSAKMQSMYANDEKEADYMDKAYQVNEYGPYADKAQAAAALKAQAEENKWKGINTVVGAAANVATANQYQKNINTVYGNKTPPPVQSTAGQPAPVATVQSKNPGLQFGRGDYMPQWDESQQAYINPMTGEVW